MISNQQIQALSWDIATKPKLYRGLAVNPYSSNSQQIISTTFPGFNTLDIIKAVILAEPEGKYDWNFERLIKEQQQEELSKQKKASVEANKRLVNSCRKYASQLNWASKDYIYDYLIRSVFGTNDLIKIESIYSQNQRKTLKIAIFNFIENNRRFTPLYKLIPRLPLFKIAITVLSLILFFYLNQRQTNSADLHIQAGRQVSGIENQEKSQGFPVRLIIPSINVDTNIQSLGVNANGEMDVSSNTAEAGWFKLGPRPGEKGSAVIAGHFDGMNGKTGVFANLHLLKNGDKLYVVDDKKIVTAFIVQDIGIYNPGYEEKVFSKNDNSHLNLVTCAGTWDLNKKTYSNRLVVFTDIYPEEEY